LGGHVQAGVDEIRPDRIISGRIRSDGVLRGIKAVYNDEMNLEKGVGEK